MSQFNTALLVVGGAVLALGLFSRQFKKWGLPDPLILLLVGVALGPSGLRLLAPSEWGDPMLILEQAARLTLAVGLMDVALRLPKEYARRQWKPLLLLLGVGMPIMWLTSSLVVGVVLGLSLWPALVIGAVVTPTDPVVSSSILTGPVAETCLPKSLRRLLSAESGFNDGLAYPFVLLPILMMSRPTGEALQHWSVTVWLWEVAAALLLGSLIGYGAGRMLVFAEARELIEKPSILSYTTALALMTLAAVKLLGSDGILAVFAGGLAFDQVVDTSERHQEQRVTEGIDRFFTLPIFALLGLLIPWEQWKELGWTAAVLVLAVLFLRRLPLLLVAGYALEDLPDRRTRAFAGWFGPIGVAALYYATMASRRTDLSEVWPVVSLLVCASVIAHGITATPLSRLYARGR